MLYIRIWWPGSSAKGPGLARSIDPERAYLVEEVRELAHRMILDEMTLGSLDPGGNEYTISPVAPDEAIYLPDGVLGDDHQRPADSTSPQ